MLKLILTSLRLRGVYPLASLLIDPAIEEGGVLYVELLRVEARGGRRWVVERSRTCLVIGGGVAGGVGRAVRDDLMTPKFCIVASHC